MNIVVIAGYDVLADKIPVHRDYVDACSLLAERVGAHLIITVGGATNPHYPELTEAEANFRILKQLFLKSPDTRRSIQTLPVGNTSAETLLAVKHYLEREQILVGKLVLCAEQSRLAGFLLDALMVGLNDLSDYIIAHGYPFPDSKKDFASQRQKMLMKVLSHRSKIFRLARNIYQKHHQRKVAKIKRKQAKASRS